jgi:hypothetical protein
MKWIASYWNYFYNNKEINSIILNENNGICPEYVIIAEDKYKAIEIARTMASPCNRYFVFEAVPFGWIIPLSVKYTQLELVYD